MRPLGDPAHRIAAAEVGHTGVDQRAADESPSMRCKRQHVGDHPAVGEDLRWVADRVDERLVKATLVDDRVHLCEKRRARFRQPGAHLRDALAQFHVEVIRLVVGSGVPHRELANEAREERAQRRLVVDPFDRDFDRNIEDAVGQTFGSGQHLADEPDVVLDHSGEQIHGGHLSVGRDPQASRRVEVHLARRVDPEARRPSSPARGRLPERARERTRERFVRGVAGVERDVKHVVVRRDQPVSRSLEQDATTKRRGWLTRSGRDEPVEMESRDVQPRRQILASRLVVVQRDRQEIDETGEGVGRRAHPADLGSRLSHSLDRVC